MIAFGTPIGGVILGLELFSANFNVSHLFESFVCSTFAYFFFMLLKNYFEIFTVDIQAELFVDKEELVLFAFLGLLLGGLASIFLTTFVKIV